MSRGGVVRCGLLLAWDLCAPAGARASPGPPISHTDEAIAEAGRSRVRTAASGSPAGLFGPQGYRARDACGGGGRRRDPRWGGCEAIESEEIGKKHASPNYQIIRIYSFYSCNNRCPVVSRLRVKVV